LKRKKKKQEEKGKENEKKKKTNKKRGKGSWGRGGEKRITLLKPDVQGRRPCIRGEGWEKEVFRKRGKQTISSRD